MKSFFLSLLSFVLPVNGANNYQIEEVSLSRQVLVTRKMEGNPQKAGTQIAQAMSEVNAFLKEKKIQPAGKPYVRTLSWTPSLWTFEAGLPVSVKPKVAGNIQVTELPEGRALKTVHKGARSSTKEAYTALGAQLEKQKLTMAGPYWVVYVSSPGETDIANYRTEVFFPVK